MNGGTENGYPFKTAGRDIPLVARITSICDAFDAITSGRPYRNARSVVMAFTEIQKYAGTQFDPMLSEFFVQNKNSLREHPGYFCKINIVKAISILVILCSKQKRKRLLPFFVHYFLSAS
jgi:hypothetical protein